MSPGCHNVNEPSLYARYVKEREGFDVVELPQGFATFRVEEGGDCYLRDIYVLPDHREAGVASRLADRVAVLAREQGCTGMLGTVDARLPGATTSLQVLLAYGFKLHSAREGYLVLRKEIP